MEQFGSGTWVAKVFIVSLVAVLLCLGASFRAATSWMKPRPFTHPAWYHSKACFYVFDFGIDIMVVALFFVARVDQRFWVPNGSSKVRHYRGVEDNEEKTQGFQTESALQKEGERELESRGSSMSRDLTETK